jgi:Amt family ammonium transporter
MLVVDDKIYNRRLLVQLLQPLGFELQEANNGQEALEIWQNWHPHLIWMDMKMPIMDGYEATQRIKSTTEGNATIIIAITASVLEEQKAVILSGGCDDFVRKPFTESIIFETITKHLGVNFIYGHTQQQRPSFFTSSLSQADLKVMDGEWISKLQQAAINLDEEEIIKLIDLIPLEYTNLIQSLNDLVKDYRFDKIRNMTNEFGVRSSEFGKT